MAQDGSTSYNFLDVTSSARIYSLGGVNITSVHDDILTTDQNPALLGPEMSMQAAFNYMRYVGGSNFAGLRYTHNVGEHGAWLAGIQYFGYGSIKEADATGSIIGTFSPKDVAFNGAFSYDITGLLRGGINVKLLYSSYAEYSAFALATDLGLNYYNDVNDLSLSFVVANLGGQIKRFTERYDRLPIDVRLGWSQSFGELPIRFSVTAWNLTKWHLPFYKAGDGTTSTDIESSMQDKFASNLFRHLVFGAEFIPSDKFYINLGYNYKTRTDMSTYSRSFLSGFSIGAGMKTTKFGFGIALSQPHTGATTFMLNISTNLYEF
jgi:hypothetical protein